MGFVSETNKRKSLCSSSFDFFFFVFVEIVSESKRRHYGSVFMNHLMKSEPSISLLGQHLNPMVRFFCYVIHFYFYFNFINNLFLTKLIANLNIFNSEQWRRNWWQWCFQNASLLTNKSLSLFSLEVTHLLSITNLSHKIKLILISNYWLFYRLYEKPLFICESNFIDLGGLYSLRIQILILLNVDDGLLLDFFLCFVNWSIY